ncbi:MAG: preprotein translocase subunit SecG [Firmicutes bacterium]|nr:preprotein translocase subunit SecG [Bacillota bacterium]
MVTFVKLLQLIISLGLIAGVLLQSGRSAGLSGAISGGAESMFGKKARGAERLLERVTSILALAFIANAIVLTVLLS